nr:Chain B, Dual specificity mitogen-activated protein kinase kinase 2 [Homo sapiens]
RRKPVLPALTINP